MVETLPIKLLTDEDDSIFGIFNVKLGKLSRLGFPVGRGVVITPPQLKLKTVLERFNFNKGSVFEQSLTLVKKEINAISVPLLLHQETHKHKHFFLNGERIDSVKKLWRKLLDIWLSKVQDRLWNSGFYKGITQDLPPQAVIFVKKVESSGIAFFDPWQDDVVINVKHHKIHPNDQKLIFNLVKEANKKLFLPFEYEWILDGEIKLVGLKPYTPLEILPKIQAGEIRLGEDQSWAENITKSAVKVFFDLSDCLTIEKNVEGIYIASEKIFDLNKAQDSFEQLVFKLIESAITYPNSPILFKLADKSEGMGKVRGTLRLLHQKSLLDPLLEALDFVRHKKQMNNVHIVIPFVRTVTELLQIKRELSVKKLSRKNSLQIWMEVGVPENIINLESYLESKLDGVVLNLDELIAHLNGFDHTQTELSFYKHEVEGLLKFLEDGIRFLHKFKLPFIAYGSLSLNPKVLEFLVEKGVYAVVVEKYEVQGIHELLHNTEKRLLLRRS